MSAAPVVMRSLRWLVERQLARLAELPALVDLAPYRDTLAQVASIEGMTATVAEAVALLEYEIASREAVQARAGRVVSAGNVRL